MFHWICPECGREIPPRLKECPSCDPQAAPVPVESSPEPSLALSTESSPQLSLELSPQLSSDPIAEQVGGPARVETADPVEATASVEAASPVAPSEPSPEPELAHVPDPLLALAEQVRSAQLEYDIRAKSNQPQPEPAPLDSGGVESSHVESAPAESVEPADSVTDEPHRSQDQPVAEVPASALGESALGELALAASARGESALAELTSAEPIPNLVELAAAVGTTDASTELHEYPVAAQAPLSVSQPLALLAQPQTVALLAQPQTVALLAQPEPVALAVESEPVALAVEPEPVALAAEPEPVALAVEPEPVALAVEPEPVALAVEPEPVALAVESEPVEVAAEPEPIALAVEPEPVASAVEPEPVALAVEPEPVALAVESEPVALAAEPEPVALAAEPEPVALAVESEPVALAAEPEPVALAVESEPVALAAEPEPVALAAEPEPVALAVEPEPVALELEPEPVALAAEPEPIALAAEPEPIALAAESEPVALAAEPESAPEPSVELTPPDPAPIGIMAVERELPAIEQPPDPNQLELPNLSSAAEHVAAEPQQLTDPGANHAEPATPQSEGRVEESLALSFSEACEPVALPPLEPVADSAHFAITGRPDDLNAGHLASGHLAVGHLAAGDLAAGHIDAGHIDALPGVPLLPETVPAEEPAEDQVPSGSWLQLAPLQNYSSAATRAMQPAAPDWKILMPDSGPRITLPGPTLPPELASFQSAKILTVRDAPRPRKFGLPGWLVSFLVMLALLVAGMGLAFYFLPVAHSSAETKGAVETATPQLASHPLAQYIEVTGFRIIVDFNKKSEIHYLVVNHSGAPVSDVTVYVTLRSDDAKAGQPPLCRFSFRVPSLAPFESKEMTSSIEKLTRSVTLPEWQNLRSEVQIAP